MTAPTQVRALRTDMRGGNAARSAAGIARQVVDATAAIPVLESARPRGDFNARAWARQLHVMRARIAHPDLTLAELGTSLGMSKDTCWRLLSRGIRNADSIRRREGVNA